jgi:hypothetical protein
MLTATSHIALRTRTAACLTTIVLVVAGGIVLMFAAMLGPAAFAVDKPKSGSNRPIMGRDLRGVNFIESCRFSHRAPDDPIVSFREAGRLARPHVRR